jgi:hypothetical protein
VYVPGASLARRIGPFIVVSSTRSFLADSITTARPPGSRRIYRQR